MNASLISPCYSTKPHEAEARERMRAFWKNENKDRPSLFIRAKNPRYSPLPDMTVGQDLKSLDLQPAYHASLMTRWTDKYEWLAEAFPGHQLTWGSCLVTLPVLAGGDYEYHDSAWIRPRPQVLDLEPPVFDPHHPVIAKLEACYRAAIESIRGRGFVSGPVMIDGLTALSMFVTPEQLCLDLIERPDDVRAWAGALNKMFTQIYDHFYKFIMSCGGNGDSVCFFGPLMEGKSESVQCDFAVMMSPRMFEKFTLPDLITVTESLDTSLYHLDGVEQLRFLDLLAQVPRLTGIQWNPQPGVGPVTDWIDAFKKIKSREWVLFIHCDHVEEAVTLTRALGPEGLYLRLPDYETVEEAEACIRRLENIS